MNSIELTAPAKVNLFLKVLDKRKDSYHNIHTIFERISLSDRIKISKIPKGIIITCDKPVTQKLKDNIAYKAAELILRNYKIRSGVRIDIKKCIPIAAGLGGGSSDAAAVLTGINKLFNLGIGRDRLMRLGAKLGADVPFFIFDEPFAIGTGIGDKLERLDPKIKLYHILIYPGFKVATKDVYQAFDLMRLTNTLGDDKMTLPKSRNGFRDLLHNDLEKVVIAKSPAVGKVIKNLTSSLGGEAIVSGSGPSVFCIYPTRREAIKAKSRLFLSVPARTRRRWQVFIVETQC